jgi:hypothetical protein
MELKTITVITERLEEAKKKRHSEYNGVLETQLTRCTIQRIV